MPPEMQSDPAAAIAAWHDRPYRGPVAAGVGALTVDVEDYFQVEAFFGTIDRARWDEIPPRVERNLLDTLDLFDEAGVKGTFFTLAWVAERFPKAVREIVLRGHELASHGTDHRRADSQTAAEFRADIAGAKQRLEDVGGVAVLGFRATSFSIGPRNLWAFEAIAEAGYAYGSSIYPVRHDLYGVPDAPRTPFHPLPGQDLVELPVATVRWFGANLPTGGGGYFRLLPYALSRTNLHRVPAPAVFYFHPWEIDPGQPRIPGVSLKTRIRHYTHLDRMRAKLARVLGDFRWSRIDRVLPALRRGETRADAA